MAEKVQRVRGTQDLYGEELARFDHVVETFNRVRKLYGFRRVDVPVFEFTSACSRARWVKPPTSCRRKCTVSKIAAANR